MKDYLVIWTYVANFGTMVISAESAEKAAERVYAGFSNDFRKRGTMYIAEQSVVDVFHKGTQLAKG